MSGINSSHLDLADTHTGVYDRIVGFAGPQQQIEGLTQALTARLLQYLERPGPSAGAHVSFDVTHDSSGHYGNTTNFGGTQPDTSEAPGNQCPWFSAK